VHTARGTDLGPGGLLDAVGLDAVVDPAPAAGRPLRALRRTPRSAALAGLAGRPTLRGLRRALESTLEPHDDRRAVGVQLLDDLPLALLLAGLPLSAAGAHPPPGTVDLGAMADVCAGWATGGELLTLGAELGHPPVSTGPRAPDAARPDDVDGVEGAEGAEPDTAPLGPLAMRRRRRIDVVPEPDGWRVEAFLRDSRSDTDGAEWVVHEYTVHATLDPDLVFRTCAAEVGVLPWRECPGALASAHRLVGTPAADLRERVPAEFAGTSTCTHLNDTLRALAALPRLARLAQPWARSANRL
jgi:hypothetical protein